MTTDVLGVVGRFVASHYSAARVAILAGSRTRGDELSSSDYDIVLLFESLQNGAWREMVEFEGQHIEVFAHDLATLAYFCHAVDRPSGFPALPVMVAEGVVVPSQSSPALTAAREIAAETLRRPPSLDTTTMRTRRFVISELVVSLRPDRDKHVLLAIGA
jgi:predicted nucleotidyltransferase